jgi:methylthioribose-1-phosphate isomerase
MTSIEWLDGKVRYLNQTCLPDSETFVETDDYLVLADAIRTLAIRGAPAIGVAAGYGIALAVSRPHLDTPSLIESAFQEAFRILAGTRPTAVNLFLALERMRKAYHAVEGQGVNSIRARMLEEAESIRREDVDACRRIALSGLELVPDGSSVLTHCHTGGLATAGGGTALFIIITAARAGKIKDVYVDETRPLLQGARLTAWELRREGLDPILITDSTAGFLMKMKRIDAVFVGADRIAANGDVANKIGTYSLAVLAEKHRIPFYVAAPLSTIDRNTPSGDLIPIEERDEGEITHVKGRRIAVEGVRVFAPAFDVTPAGLVSALITDRGTLRPPYPAAIARVFGGTAAGQTSP